MATAPPAMRIKSHWHKPDAARTPAEQAGAMAFIVWRVARRMLERMRGADFDIDAGPTYFAFLREGLAFLVAVVDRLAAERLDAGARVAFTLALAHAVARTLADNEDDLLGAPAPGAPTHAGRFVDLVNEVAPHYAEFDPDPSPPEPALGFHPGFAALRYLGSRLAPTLPDKDRPWVLDQVIAIEAPEAVAVVRRSMHDLHDPSPQRARRTRLSGD